uniref:Uncharacterized protein n=1 Tax=Anguilla anguilla TaxID=7936 RepID=A0A0E9R718_ANGAN
MTSADLIWTQEATPPHHHSPSHWELEGFQPEHSPLQGWIRRQTDTVRERLIFTKYLL